MERLAGNINSGITNIQVILKNGCGHPGKSLDGEEKGGGERRGEER